VPVTPAQARALVVQLASEPVEVKIAEQQALLEETAEVEIDPSRQSIETVGDQSGAADQSVADMHA
jgi:hypothetical protein